MAKIAFLGLGAMGSRMVAHLLHDDDQVTVWNRTLSVAESFISQGATVAKTPREAVDGADFVFSMVRDDDASHQVWLDEKDGALHAMKNGAVAIESSTLTPSWTIELSQHAAKSGVFFIEAPVSGTTPQAQSGDLIYLIGGELDLLNHVKPLLEKMGSGIHHVGAVGNGAFAKLVTNSLLGIQVTALAELIGILKTNDCDVTKILDAVSATPVWSTIAQRAYMSMSTGNFAPQFPVELIEKDFRYTIEQARSEEDVPTISGAHSLFDSALAAGFGKLNMSAVAKFLDDK